MPPHSAARPRNPPVPAPARSKVLAVCLVVVACLVCAVLVLRTLAGIARLKVFIPEHKWGPMSHLPLAQASALRSASARAWLRCSQHPSPSLRLLHTLKNKKNADTSPPPHPQEALRHLLARLGDTTAALAASPGNARLAARAREEWRAFKTVNTFYTNLKVGGAQRAPSEDAAPALPGAASAQLLPHRLG